MDEVGWKAPAAAERGVDSQTPARVRAKDLIRSSLEKWTLKASVCVRAPAGRRVFVSVCKTWSNGLGSDPANFGPVQPSKTVLRALKSHKTKTSRRARSTSDNCLDESLEAALTFKKRATLAFITEEERGAFAARTKRFPLGARDGKASKGQPSKAARPEPQGWNHRVRQRWMFSAGYLMLHLWTLSCCPQLKEENQGYWPEQGGIICSQLIWEETA